MPKPRKGATLGQMRNLIPQWIMDDLAEREINEPQIVAFEDNPGKYVPFILLGKNEDETIRGFSFDPLNNDTKPIHGIESLPNSPRVSLSRISSNPSQRLTL